MLIKPLELCISPRRAEMREDFPDPTAPTTATSRPGLISKEMLQIHTINIEYSGNKYVVSHSYGVKYL